MRIGYILEKIPRSTETFIAREMHALIEHNTRVSVFPIWPLLPDEKACEEFPDAAEIVSLKKTAGAFLRIFLIHIVWFLRRPVVYVSIVGECLFPFATQKKGLFIRCFHIAYYVRKHNIIHLHAHYAGLASTLTRLVSKVAGVPYSFTTHARDIFVSTHDLTRDLSDARFAVTISSYNRNVLIERYGDCVKNKLHVIPCGVDEGWLMASHDFPQENRKGMHILSAGRLIEKKGFDRLIDAVKTLRERNVDVHCTILGEGELRTQLEARIKEARINDYIRLPGFLATIESAEIYTSADLFVLPCTVASNGDMDGIPVVLMEAMAFGIPVISTPVSGIPELIEHGNNGWLVSDAGKHALADTIALVLALPENERRRIIRQAYKTMRERFSINKNAARLLEEIVGNV